MSNPLTYFAKVENGVVVDVRVVAWEFLVANPERYGDSSQWVETFHDNSQRGKYAGIGDVWDGEKFVAPAVESPS